MTRVGAPLFRRADPGSPFEIVFVEVEIEGEPEPLEHDALRWATPADMVALSLAPADRAFADWLRSRQ